jgi:predicted Zn finger-like uncharacterized protein
MRIDQKRTMLIVCPNCAKSYQVDADSIGAKGRSVRCIRCKNVWFAAPVAEPAPAASATADAVAGDEAAFRTELGADATSPAAEPAAEDAPAEESPVPPAVASEPEPPPAADPPPDAHDAPTQPAAEPVPAEPIDRPVALSDIRIPMIEAPPLAPGPADGAPPAAAGAAIDNSPEDIESVAARMRARRAARRRKPASKRPLPAAILLMVAVVAALLAWRKDIVRSAPQMASLYAAFGLAVNLRGLEFKDVRIANETHDGVPVLVVEGTIVSTASAPVDVPRLRFALRNAAGAEVYSWTTVPTQSVLEPGGVLPFRGRLASPPAEGRDVQVRFFNRRDAAAGAR